MALRGVLFDKDGTLFGFQSTWGAWGRTMMLRLVEGEADAARHLAEAIGLDFDSATYLPDSPAIAGTEEEIVALLAPLLPHWSEADLMTELALSAAGIHPVEAVPLAPLLAELAAAGVRLGVATNDGESAARAQLRRIGVLAPFDQVYGYDSGYGAKPEPGPCLAFAAAVGLKPAEVAMVGDSAHDLKAGRAAGMVTVGVLTGPARESDLAPLADVVLPDIGYLPGWLAQSGA